MFSCKTRGFCPSCHAKRLEEWGEWMRETLLLDVPHRQVVFTIPKMLRFFFEFKRKLLGDLCRCAERVGKYMIRPVLALERLSFLEPEGKVVQHRKANLYTHDVDGQSAAWRAPAGDATGPAGELAAGRHRYGLFVAIYSWLQNCQRHTVSHPEAGFRAALSSSPGFGPWEVWKE